MADETRAIVEAYARAMLAVAEAGHVVDVVENDLRDVGALYETSPELREFLATPGMEGAGKRDALEGLLTRHVHPIVVAHLGLLAQEGHGHHVAGVVASFIEQAAQARGMLTAEVTTAVALDADQERRLQEALTKRTGRTIVLRTVVDKAVTGGVVVRLGDEVIDGSVRTRVSRLRSNLAAT